MYHIFDSEEAFCFAKGKEENIAFWRNCLLERLEPDITILPEYAQNQILALLAKEKAQFDGKKESVSFFERLMDYIEEGKRHGIIR